MNARRWACVGILFWAGCGSESAAPVADAGTVNFDATPETLDTAPEVSPEPAGCVDEAIAALEAPLFVDISTASGIRVGNHEPNPVQSIPINDHSRLAFAEINGDGVPDMVMHSLYPNPQAGIPFEHLVFLGQGDGTYVDHSTASGLRDVQVAFFVFGDLDNDGDQDAVGGLDVGLPAQRHQVLLNDGSGVFTPVVGSGIDTDPNTWAGNAVLADFNGDAKLDLYIGNGHTSAGVPDSLWWGQGNGTFSYANVLGPTAAHASNGTVTCDYDEDGDLDIFVSSYGVSVNQGHNTLWENQDGLFVDVAAARGFAAVLTGNPWLATTGFGADPEPGATVSSAVGSNGFGLDCADVNGDGLMDIFITAISHPVDSDYSRKWSDPTMILLNQGPDAQYAFVDATASMGFPFNEGDVDGAAVDFDNDGRVDLSISRDSKYEKNYTTDAQKSWFGLMHQQADGTFADLSMTAGINAIDGAHSASLADCTSDADCTSPDEACILDRCRLPCTTDDDCPTVHEMCHSGGFCKLYATMKKAQNHGWADVDLDGDLDLLVGGRDNGGGRPNFLFRNDAGHTRRWVGLRLEGDGVAVNRDAIGARVTITEGDAILTDEVHSSRGMHSSADQRALLFGLAELSCAYTLSVRWPDGTTASFDGGSFAERRYLRLVYPDQLIAD